MENFCKACVLDKNNLIIIQSENETKTPMVSIGVESYGVGQEMLLSRAEFAKFAAIVREVEAAIARGEAQP